MWKFFGLDNLSNEQLECISDKGNKALECLADCKSERCRYKCTGKLVPNLSGCLKVNPEKPEEEEEETIEEVEEPELEVETRFMFNHLNNIPDEGSYIGDQFARFTPIEGDAYTVNIQSPIYPKLAEKLLKKTKGRRGELIYREDLDELKGSCRNRGGFLRGGNHTKDC